MPVRAGAEADVPRPIVNNLVKAAPQLWRGRECLSVELTDEEQRGRLAKTRTSNGPSYAIVHRSFNAGVIEYPMSAPSSTERARPMPAASWGLHFT